MQHVLHQSIDDCNNQNQACTNTLYAINVLSTMISFHNVVYACENHRLVYAKTVCT